VIVCFVDMGGIVDHHLLNFPLVKCDCCFVDMGGIVDHHFLNFPLEQTITFHLKKV
jgi:hypothetical protein